MTDYQFRIGSMVYPQQRVVVDAGNNASNLGESYNELRKCVGVLGNYMHNSYLNPRTYRLGPRSSQTPAVFDAGDAVGITVDAANDFLGNSGTSGDTKNLFVAAYGFEGFAKTAAESGINVSDRALPVVCEVNRVEVTRAGGCCHLHPSPLRYLRPDRHDYLPHRRRTTLHPYLNKFYLTTF